MNGPRRGAFVTRGGIASGGILAFAILVAGPWSHADDDPVAAAAVRTIHVKVVDWLTAAPLAHAAVRLDEGLDPELGEEFSPLQQALTDERGECSLSIAVPAHPLRVRLQAEADGHAPMAYRARMPAGLPHSYEIAFRLLPGVAVVGKVLDAEGSPVSGARIEARHVPLDPGEKLASGRPDPAIKHAVSGVEGAFRIDGVLPGGLLIRAESDGRGGGCERMRVLGEEACVIRLWPPHDAVGRVRDATTNAPVAGAWIDYDDRESGWSGVVRTQADGSFKMRDLPPGVTDLGAWLEGYDYAALKIAEAGAEGAYSLARMRSSDEPPPLHPGGSIAGVVRHRRDRLPVAGIQVSVLGQGTTTNAQGEFRLSGLAGGSYEVSAALPGMYAGEVPGTTTVVLEEGQELTGVELVVDFRPARLWGRVLGRNGEACAGGFAMLQFSESPAIGPTLDQEYTSSRGLELALDGSFEESIIHNGRWLQLHVRHGTEGVGRSRILGIDGLARHGPIEVRLAGCVPVTGHVRDAAGRPIAGAFVRAQRVMDSRRAERSEFGSEPVYCISDWEGTFVLPAPSGPVAISVEAEEFCAGVRHYAWLEPEEQVRRIDLTIPRAGVVRARALRRDGTPMGAALWKAESTRGAPWTKSGATEEDGCLVIPNVPELTHAIRIIVEKEGESASGSDLPVNAPEVELRAK